MRRWLGAALLLPLIACGGSPSAPSPLPIPAPALTPAPSPPTPIVQPDPSRFDATFNAQLVHGTLDHPGASDGFRALTQSPSIYLQRSGLSDATVAALEQAARMVVPAMSGGMLTVGDFQSGEAARTPTTGWITVDIINDVADTLCGKANVGGAAGHVWLNMAHPDTCTRPLQHVLAHEIGHALGFQHVADPACLMSVSRPLSHDGEPCDKERYHAGLAYQSNGAYAAPIRVPMVVD